MTLTYLIMHEFLMKYRNIQASDHTFTLRI
jgi:hypothetical protein